MKGKSAMSKSECCLVMMIVLQFQYGFWLCYLALCNCRVNADLA